MKPVPRTDFEKAVLCRSTLVETVIGELKNLCQSEHTRHRSVGDFLVSLMAGIVAYRLSDGKSSLNRSAPTPWQKPDRLSRTQASLCRGFFRRDAGPCRGLASPPWAIRSAGSARPPPAPSAHFPVVLGIVGQVLKVKHRGTLSRRNDHRSYRMAI